MSESENTVALTGRELLTSVYGILKKDGKEITFPPFTAYAEIGDDSDGHRERKGYTNYESAALINISGKEYLIALGKKFGSYPADPYDCDIFAAPFNGLGKSDEEMLERAGDALRRNDYFEQSIIVTMATGSLGIRPDGDFGSRIRPIIEREAGAFVAQNLEVDPNHVTLSLQPIVISSMKYKPEFVAFLCDTFRKVLTE